MKQENELGELAMAVIRDYPLYASTSGVTYEEAVAIAKVLQPNLISIEKE